SPHGPRTRARALAGPVAFGALVAIPVFLASLFAPNLSVVSAFAQEPNEQSSPASVPAPAAKPPKTPPAVTSTSPLEQKLPVPPRKADVKKGKQAFKQGLKLEDQGDWQAAYDAYSDAVDWDPSNRDYLVRQAVAKGHVVQMKVDLAERDAVSGRLTSALHAMRQAREMDPSNRTIRERLIELEALDPMRARQIVSQPELAPEVHLQHRAGTQTFQLRGQTQGAYQEVAQRFGVEVAFDVDLRNVPVRLDLKDADFVTVMRVLGEETGTFWRPLTKHLFFVAQDTQQKRKDYDVSILRTVLLSASETPEQMTELSRMVREVAGITRTDLDTKSHTLTMRASPQAIAVATGIIDDLEQPPAELILEIEVLEVNRSRDRDLGITGPQTATIYSIPSNSAQLIAEGGATALNGLLEQVFGSSSAIPPVFAFGGGKTTFLGTLPGAAASFSDLLSTVRAGRRVLLRAEDGQPASFFVGERYPVSLAQYSSSLVGTANNNSSTQTATQTATVSGSTGSSVPITTLTTGTNPDFVVTGDVNNDNFQDLVVANFTDGTLSVFLGGGLGSFGTPTTVPVGKGPTWIATGNFNAKTNTSGIIDLAVANQVDNTVSILLGNGDGTFTAAPSSPLALPSGSSPTSIAVGDFNKDGYADLAVVNMAANTISIFLGNGDGTFKTPTTVVTGSTPTSIVAAAFNPSNPSLIDLAVTNSADNTLEIFIGNGDGTFQKGVTYNTGVTPLYVAAADLNVDGNLDLAVADSGVATSSNTVGNSVSIFLGNGDGTFILPGGSRLDYPAGTNPTSITVADFNDDGLPDLVVTATGDNSFSLLLGGGGGTFDSPIEVPVGTTPDSGATADFNGDGLPDLAISNYGSNSVSVILDSSSLISLLSGSGVGTQFPGAEYIDIGLKVKATPRVHPDGDVTLQFEFTLSSLAGASLNNIPVVNNQEIHQTVRVRTDQTAALAAYLAPQTSTSLNGSPGLGDLPLNGIVGGTTTSQYSDSELLILVTPRMVEMGTARKDHMIYAGRGQLGGATSLGPSIQERRGGFQLPEPEQRTPPPQPEPQPQPPPQPQPQTEVPQPAEQPPANIPPQPNNPEPPQ
ncbi:MAG: FG-GAP-like repeat-containing protein, partial [Candidatus Acidiferrales bacterium]